MFAATTRASARLIWTDPSEDGKATIVFVELRVQSR